MFPNDTPPLALADAAIRQGLHARAAAYAQTALEQSPGDLNARMLLGASLLGVGRFEDAVGLLEPLARERAGDPGVLYNLASALRGLRRFDEAGKVIDKALGVRPGDPQLIALKARLLIGARKLDDAAKVLESALKQRPGEPNLSIEFAEIAHTAGRLDEALSHIETAQQYVTMYPPQVAHALGFAHAKLLDGAGRHDEAFVAYDRANAARNMPWDSNEHSRRIDATIKAWSPERVASLPRAEPSDRLIFIVGMPRSGTTLVDQILSMHSRVFAGGEQMVIPRLVKRLAATPQGVLPIMTNPSVLTQSMIDSTAKEVREHFAALAGDAPRVTDKFPQNMLHLGPISLMAPGSRIVHIRRDPLDTCLSCYFQNFLGTMPYMYNLEHIGRFFADYVRLMDHWRHVLDLDILDLDYAALVENQEQETRRLLEFLSLDWEDSCLQPHKSRQAVVTASHVQVSNPVYTTSLARWQRYDKRLRPLVEPLGALLSEEQKASLTG